MDDYDQKKHRDVIKLKGHPIMNYLQDYYTKIQKIGNTLDFQAFEKTIALIKNTSTKGGKLIFVGNGGSAAIASHMAVDFTKACGIRAVNFNEADLLTCFANDYGYENWVVEALRAYSDENDLVILISSSGSSPNIVNGANYCRQKQLKLVCLSGFKSDNPVAKLGDVNVWVDSTYYNFIEMVHHIWLVALVDKISLGNDAFK